MNKAFVTVLSILASVLIMGRSVFASVAVPLFPYMPPADVQMFDMLFNAFGMTKPDIADDAKRLEGYWKLFESATIANVEATKALIQKAFDNAKTSRVIELSPEDIDTMRLVGKVALRDGVQSGYEAPVADLAQVHQELTTQGITIGLDTLTNMYTYAKAQLGYDVSLCYIWGFVNSSNTIVFGWHNKANRATFNNVVPYKWQVNGDTWISQFDISPTGVVGNRLSNARYSIELSSYWTGLRKAYDFGEKSESKSVTAQNAQISDAINQGTLIPITAETALVNGVIDATKPFRMRLPVKLPVPADTVAELPAVQEKLGVVPISDDVADTVQTLKDALTAEYGDTSDYSLDLTRYFPFCIPFDIGRLLGAFVAEPVAPVVPFTFPVGYEDGEIVMRIFNLDLSQFDSVAYWCRKGELLLFIVGLGVVTRQWFLRG